ncbi:hypothetical protein G6F46_012818 [Rhizopus delemar]|uniref:Tyr recombinase domain-containing protein n=3 Tax=Rhizopus TaxID=4842 RepID=I1CHA4_RHIO9|nr:hypothetical protein RO3G_12545 [Rhizopus delemar RA 99-880]KAG1148161.1 hypothetical protein G6F36_014851 [Rhizopus arrhizus]KAG1443119.1 hypothetical protein G6F55_012762 [Rhizopus delemar]KAG1487141.1 hypothetical protein G6F54_012844 [Rhizopus delemar]KAG1493913.1 hypothetical protein G6F53_012666 [Rhizopus delemar]|eukprot:EIE87834.1 hypothetical protein RO3G_12545 [Rhizopus delemar RA 99-880]
MWRPRSDIGEIQLGDITFVLDKSSPVPIGATIVARTPKEINPKASKLGAIADKNCYPVYTLWCFYNATREGRAHLPEDHKLFLTGLHEHSEGRWKSAATGTVASWLKDVMELSGIDTTKHTVHSIRAAASTKAVSLGMTIDEVKDHANWSRNSSILKTITIALETNTLVAEK